MEPINMDHLLEDHQRAINFLTTGTQTEKQRFVDLLIARRDQEWEARETASSTRRTPRKPDIYRYAETRGINSSLIRSFYELPIASPQKSHQGITIRRNKQSTCTAKSLSPYLNRTESSHSSNSKRAPNMIPCFPANSNTHITEDSLPNISQIRTRSTTKQSNHCLENQKGGYYLRYTKTGKRSCRIITDSSQED